MLTYGEIIQALQTLKNVKERRQGIKTLANMCANRAFQVRIVQRGGWQTAILPLIISLDEDCRRYAALAIANLSACVAAHRFLHEEEVLKQLGPILLTEESVEVIVYVLNALGNFACSSAMWPSMHELHIIEAVVSTMQGTTIEEVQLNSLFCLSNMTSDPHQRKWMLEQDTYEAVWGYMKHPNYRIMQYALATLRGLSVEPEAQEKFARMGLVPMLLGISQSDAPEDLKMLALDIFLHLSFLTSNAKLLLQPNVLACIENATKHPDDDPKGQRIVATGMSIIANLCENTEFHHAIIESVLFQVLTKNIRNDTTAVQQHVVRAMMQLSRSPQFHHVLVATGVTANACPIAMTERLTPDMRTHALQLLGSICATHPTTPVESDILDLYFLTCNANEHMDVRRASMMVLANAASDKSNREHILRGPCIEALVKVLSETQDTILADYMTQFFHNLTRMDPAAAKILINAGYQKHMFKYEVLESISVSSAIYLCDTCRHMAEDPEVRSELMAGMLFSNVLDTWVHYAKNVQIQPHLALMCSAFAYHPDMHQELVLQGGVRLVVDLYQTSQVEHVRFCCILSLLYLADSQEARRSILLERGMQMLIAACENETHVDLITNALKALIPFASSDDYRPQLGMEGALDTFASFMFSDQLTLQQLGVFLLQNMLELRGNRRIFLGLAEERKCEEEYLEALARFLPRLMDVKKLERINRSMDRTKRKGKDPYIKDGQGLTPHDPFIVRTVILSLELLSREYDHGVYEKFKKYQVPKLLFDLFTSEQIDKASGEAVLLLFANLLHGKQELQAFLLKSMDLLPVLLACSELQFSRETNERCLSALLALARCQNFRPKVVGQLEAIMDNVSQNLNQPARDEVFFGTAALQCGLLSELARASVDFHERMAKAGVVDALLVFITVARGVQEQIGVELLMSAVFGITALVSSPKAGEQCMQNLVFPASRFQLFMSLLRKPEQEEISGTFHAGTIGLRTLQRSMDPSIRVEELEVDCLGVSAFIERCEIPPAHFLYRSLVRSLCLLLAHREMGRRVLEALSPQNAVPTCILALQATSDIYVQVFGYILVAKFSGEASLMHGFTSDVAVITELLSCCRRYVCADEERAPTLSRTASRRSDQSFDRLSVEQPTTPSRMNSRHTVVGSAVDPTKSQRQLNKHGSGPWGAKSVGRNKYLLAMVAMTHFAEYIKEKFKPPDDQLLAYEDQDFLRRFAALSLRDLDCDAMLMPHSMGGVAEFTALLQVVVASNCFISRIGYEQGMKGGEVKVEPVDAKVSPKLKVSLKSNEHVPLDLRSEFKNLAALQRKTEGLLDAVASCLEVNAALQLAIAIVECLCGITYFSPLSIANVHDLFRILKSSPEWLMPGMSCLFANVLAHKARLKPDDAPNDGEEDPMIEEDSEPLFMLISKSLVETRERMIGALSNMSIQKDKFEFVKRSGIFKLYTPLRSRGYFLEHFAWMLQLCRLLTNTFCAVESSNHKDELLGLVKPGMVGFLRDVLHLTAELLAKGEINPKEPHEPEYEYYTVVFGEDDMPPLGLKIWWALPPRLTEVIPDSPATFASKELRKDDELVEVNGIDVMQLEKEQILPLFDDRPLKMVFRHPLDLTVNPMPNGPEGGVTKLYIEEVSKLECYGDRLQYLECFHLVLLTLHNMATQNELHGHLLAEPQILTDLLDVIPHDMLSPSLRRLVFSAVSCLAEEREYSGRIFQAMKDYFDSCEKADPSLNKYVLLCANLFYTSQRRDEVRPDEELVGFIGRIVAVESAEVSDMALVEIMHGMAQAPQEQIQEFTTRETMVSAVNFVENQNQWSVQARAFEAVLFLTKGACQADLWASIHLVPRVIKAASALQLMAERAPEFRPRADAAWDLALRTAQVCLPHDSIVRSMVMPELDRGLLEIFLDERKPVSLAKCAADLMAGLLQTEVAEDCWSSWRSMGLAERLLRWARRQLKKLNGDMEGPELKAVKEVPLDDILDSVVHMLSFAVEVDPSVVGILAAEDITQCIAKQILSHANFFHKVNALENKDAEEVIKTMEAATVAFRHMAQLMTALLASDKGLAAMTGMGLEPPLIALLDLPPNDFQVSALLMLCALSGNKQTSVALLNSKRFMALMASTEEQLNQAPSNMDPQEFEYFVSLVDRACCHPDLSPIVLKKHFLLVCRLPVRSLTSNSQLLGARVVAQCGLQDPQCLSDLNDIGLTCLHYLLGATSCLSVQNDENDRSMIRPRRKSIVTKIADMRKSHPVEARLAAHYSRATVCAAVSAVRSVCQRIFGELDCAALLAATTATFGEARVAMEEKKQLLDVTTAEVLNHVVGMLHILLCVVFRQGNAHQPYVEPSEKIARYIVSSLISVLDEVFGCLQLHRAVEHDGRSDTTAKIADRLCADIRVQFYLSALLREICARPLESSFLGVVRTRSFHLVLEGAIHLARKRLDQEVNGPAPKDLFAKRQVKGMRDSPLMPHLEDFNLALVFEHLIVAMRHMLVQAMYVKPVAGADGVWCWGSQEQLELHKKALTWLPEVATRHGKVASIKTEVVRYLCAMSSFYEAPQAVKEPPGSAVYELCRTYSLVQPDMLELITKELEAAKEATTQSLACLAVANLAQYEWSFRKDAASKAALPELPTEGLGRLARAVVRALLCVPEMPREQDESDQVGVVCTKNAYRALSTFLSLAEDRLTYEIIASGAFEAVQTAFEFFFRNVATIRSVTEYTVTLQHLVLLLRNWITGGCTAEKQMEVAARSPGQKADSQVWQEAKELETMSAGLDTPTLLNFFSKVVLKLREEGRTIPDRETVIDGVFGDLLLSLRRLLERASSKGAGWDRLNLQRYEQVLEWIMQHRFRRTGNFEDPEIMGILYLMTLQHFPYVSTAFPKYMMELAYGPRKEHTQLQDLAAVACAIESTRVGKGKATSRQGAKGVYEVASVITDYADFVHSIARLKTPRMQVWHYRLLAGECQRASVLEEVAGDEPALTFIVERLSDAILGRYSVAILHNISVHRSRALVSGKHLNAMCEAYRSLGENKLAKDEKERKLLRRLALAAVRNCLLDARDLARDLGQEDLAAIVALVRCLESCDVPMYLAMLLTLCRRSLERATALLSAEPMVVDLLARCLLEKTNACMPSNFHARENAQVSDLYVMQAQEEALERQREEEAAAAEEEERRLAEERTRRLSLITPPPARRQTDTPASPAGRGLGKRTNLWQTKNRARTEKALGASPAGATQGASTKGEMISRPIRPRKPTTKRGNEHEYVYFAAEEILTDITFMEVPEVAAEAEADARQPESGRRSRNAEIVRKAVDTAFQKHTVSDWLKTLRVQVDMHDKMRIQLTDVFVRCTAKFAWHCWANPLLRAHIDTGDNLEVLAAIAPTFLGWSDAGVNRLYSEVALYARLHKFPEVTGYVAEHHSTYPELSTDLMAHALVDSGTVLRPHQAHKFLNSFVELLQARALSRLGLRRLLVGFEHALLTDHPRGIAANLIKIETELFMRLLQALNLYGESPVVKHCMAVALSQTLWQHYQAVPELDEFVLFVLDIAGPLLESDFATFLPVLHKLVEVGGRRVAQPLIQRQLHIRVALLLEEAVDALEMPEDAPPPIGEGKGPILSETARIQWSLALLTLLAGCEELETQKAGGPGEIARAHEPHLEAFVCVDLLPVLVRVLRASPHAYETLGTTFLMSSVAHSACIPPYMPDIVRLAERSILPRLTVEGGGRRAKFTRRRESTDQQGTWHPMILPIGERMLLGVNRSFIHLLARAGYQPHDRPALLNSEEVFRFVCSLECDADMFADPAGPLHVKLHCLAHLCARKENHPKLLQFGVLDVLRKTQIQIAEAAEMMEEFAEEPYDLRLYWLHAVSSLLGHPPTGARVLANGTNADLVEAAIEHAETINLERRPLRRLRGLGTVYEGQAALAQSIGRLVPDEAFTEARQVCVLYTSFLLGLACSAPLSSLRVAACDRLLELLARCTKPLLLGAVLLRTPCCESFRRTIWGPNDELVSACAKVMGVFAQKCGYSVHVHLAQNAETALTVISDAKSSASRVSALAELFLVFSMRTEEVMAILVEIKTSMPFLRLAKSTSPVQREAVQRWLELYGSSMYEVDEVMRAFAGSSVDGYLHLAARCTLEPEKAADFRRCMFAVIHARIENWRVTPFGITQFMSEELMKAMVPMCEMQPDLTAALVAVFHSFITHNEKKVLARLWTGGHVPWLFSRMTLMSSKQRLMMEADRGSKADRGGKAGPTFSAFPTWEKHKDLIVTQGMSQRLLKSLYDDWHLEVGDKVVELGLLMKNWIPFATYYCHHVWPMREVNEIDDGTHAVFILAMKYAQRLTFDSNTERMEKLLEQGILRLCSLVLLPSPVEQRQMRAAVHTEGEDRNVAEEDPAEAHAVQTEKMIAGSITVWLMQLRSAYEYFADPRNADLTVSMLSQLHRWRKAVFHQQGSISVKVTVGLLERSAALYATLVSGLTVEWFLAHIGLRFMQVLGALLLEFWCRHPNSVLKHHSLRMVSLFCQLHVLFVSIFAFAPKGELASQAIHRILGIWDVRELRHVVRLITAALAHALGIPVMPEHISVLVARGLKDRDAGSLAELLRMGGILRANQLANKYILLPKYITSMVEWCEHPGDLFGRTWSQWIVLTLFAHGQTDEPEGASAETGVIDWGREVEEEHVLRRARLEQEQLAVNMHEGVEAPLVRDILPESRLQGARCSTRWASGSPRLGAVLARMAGKCVVSEWRPAELVACVTGARCSVEHPHFICNAAETVSGKTLVQLVCSDNRSISLAALAFVALLSTYRMPLKAQNCSEGVLTCFYNLQQTVIEGLCECGEGPFDKLARWLHELPLGSLLVEDTRCIVCFMIGQCILPPLAVAPSLSMSERNEGAPPVANCDPPPHALMEKLAADVLAEDERLREQQVKGEGPLFSTALCHLLYALAVMVPIHPKIAAESSRVRGAAFSQLFKIQQIVAWSVRARDLFDPVDKDRGKLFLYIRALACIRLALRIITGSWFASDIGVRFVISEQGGRDFMQYCTRHIISVYNSKTAVTRVLGTPWERLMLSQGPTDTIAEVLLMVCSSDANLLELERLGGEKALHALSQYATSWQLKQQATVLLSKVAIMTRT